MITKLLLVVAFAGACSKSAEPPPAPELTCKDAIAKLAKPGDKMPENVEFGIRQCELEKWLPALKQCIHDAPDGANLEAECFSKFPKRGTRSGPIGAPATR